MASKLTLQKAATQGNGKPGSSDGAIWRRQRNATGTIYSGAPGGEVRIGAVVYRVARDGSFRRQV